MLRARFYLGSRAFDPGLPMERRAVRVVGHDFILRAHAVAHVLAALGLPGATITPAVGIWQDTTEPSVVVEVLGGPELEALAPAVAENLRARFAQDSVLWTVETLKAHGSADR